MGSGVSSVVDFELVNQMLTKAEIPIIGEVYDSLGHALIISIE